MQHCLPHLRNLPLFRDARVSDLEILARASSIIQIQDKSILFRVGDPCTGFHVLLRGKVRLSLTTPQGLEKPILFIEPGGSFGDLAMFFNRHYYVNAQALENCLLIFLPRAAVVDLIQRDGEFALRMISSLASRMQRIVSDIESFTLYPPMARLPLYLSRRIPPNHAPGRPCQIVLDINKKMIAAQLNMTPATLSRNFKSLSEQGMISAQGRVVLVHDIELLKRYVERTLSLVKKNSSQ